MQNDSARSLLIHCLEYVMAGDTGHYVEHPAIKFASNAEAGKYDHLPKSKYDILLRRIENLSTLWDPHPRRTAGELLLAMLERIALPPDQLEDIAAPLSKWYDREELRLDEFGNPLPDDGFEFTTEIDDIIAAMSVPRRPKEIRDAIAARVLCQPEGTRAAAMILYGHLSGRRSNSVFCGPSGCGKSEIWRCLSKEYPGLIRIVDFSRMSGEGWNGSLHLRDVFDGIDKGALARNGLIVVFDEADKILCETVATSAGNHNQIVQNNLLKMLDGDVIDFGNENGRTPFTVNCANVSVVMLGAFETLLAGKAASRAKHIGFGGAAPEEGPPEHKDIGYDDMIDAGMRREIAGRINRIVAMAPLDAAGYKSILEGPVLSGLEESYKCRIVMDDAAAAALSEQAVTSGLGVRWMRSTLVNAIEDELFDECEAEEFRVDMRDGKLICRAQASRKVDSAKIPRAVPGNWPGPAGWYDDAGQLPF